MNLVILLETKGLTIHYGSPRGEVKAAEDVNIRLDKEEIIGLAGESGSGKSTLAMGILRL